jgi:hypothetical protein
MYYVNKIKIAWRGNVDNKDLAPSCLLNIVRVYDAETRFKIIARKVMS